MHARRATRLIDKLVREVVRAETQALEHATREARRIGDADPTHALRAVAAHAQTMQPRFATMVSSHGLALPRSKHGSRLAILRNFMTDHVTDAEHAFRSALMDLRHGVDVVQLLREVVHREELFGLIRWSDDWLGARRTLVARVEAQLPWFVEHETREIIVDEPHDPEADTLDVARSTAEPEP